MRPSDGQRGGLSVGGIDLPACFGSVGGELTVDGIPVRDLTVRFGTPCYVYAASCVRETYWALAAALDGFAGVFYSIKANPNPALVACLLGEGAGIEVASLGEYRTATRAGADPRRILFAGPGKRRHELAAVLADGIGEIHLESLDEARLLSACAVEAGRTVAVAIRVNPVETAQGGAMRMGGKASAFGFDEESLPEIVPVLDALPNLNLQGLHVYSGTQILAASTFEIQWRHALDLARRVAAMRGRPLATLDLGGGLGVPYHAGDVALDLAELAALAKRLNGERLRDPALAGLSIVVEPGRYLVGAAGVYVSTVTSVKRSRGQRFVVTDGGMHHHLAASGNLGQVIKRNYPVLAATRLGAVAEEPCQVVGPLCTPLDTLARKAMLPPLEPGDLIAIFQSGAYGLTASPVRFLSHDPPAEVLVDAGEAVPVSTR